jgi:hypothetical protein
MCLFNAECPVRSAGHDCVPPPGRRGLDEALAPSVRRCGGLDQRPPEIEFEVFGGVGHVAKLHSIGEIQLRQQVAALPVARPIIAQAL